MSNFVWPCSQLTLQFRQVLNVKPREFRGPSEDSEFAMIQAMFAARASSAASEAA